MLILSIAAVCRSQEKYVIPACSHPMARNLIGGRLKIAIQKNASAERGSDVDYSFYNLSYVVQKKTFQISGSYGPMVSSAAPQDWLRMSTEVRTRTWKHGKLEGVDVSGKHLNGNYWRFLSGYREWVRYHDVPGETATLFDQVIDKVCFREKR